MNWLLQQRCIVAITLLCFSADAHAIESPERNVEGNVLISDREPKVRIQLPNDPIENDLIDRAKKKIALEVPKES